MIMDTRTSFGPGIPFLGQFGPEYQNCQFKLKFGTKTNCNMQNSMVMFILFIHPFWESLVQKIKVVSLNWKLASRLIRICRIQRWCLFFLFLTGKPFSANLVQKINIVSLSWNLVPRLIRICRIEWWCSLFPFLTESTLFG